MSFIIARSIILQVFLAVIILLVFLEYFMFSYLSKRKVTDLDTKTVSDYETVLCRLEFERRSTGNQTGVCPTEGIVTAFKHWSLARNMWIYTNVIALSIASSLRCYVPFCLKDSLGQVFTNLSVPLLGNIGHCILPLAQSVSSLDDWNDVSQSIVISGVDRYTDVTMKYLDIASREFVFNDALTSQARDFLTKVRRNFSNDKSVVYVGVYITKTPIILSQDLDDMYPDVNFFFRAMKYFRSNYENPAFVVICDRGDVWRSLFKAKDIFVVEEQSLNEVGAVLSILSHCNHTILSSDGIAIWGAILAGGEAVLSVSLSEDHNVLIKHYNQWIYVNNDSQAVNRYAISSN